MENEELDYAQILADCGVGNDDTSQIVKNIANLEEFYDSSELVSIYNYALLNIENPEIILQVIKFTDAHRAISTMNILLDLLLLKTNSNKESDVDSLVNVRAMCAKAISNYKDNSTVSSLLYCMNNKNEHYKTIPVKNGMQDMVGTYIPFGVTFLLSEKDDVEVIYKINEYVTAPVKKNEEVGEGLIYVNGKLET